MVDIGGVGIKQPTAQDAFEIVRVVGLMKIRPPQPQKYLCKDR